MKDVTYLEAIREALFEEMRRDPKVFVLGEDVGPYGGAFGATRGLYDEFGELRCLDTPISESAIVGVSIGAELSAVITEERFESLDAPVLRITYPDTHCPFAHVLEQTNLPNADKITEALRKLAAY
jgi:pyruvate dehydrogenase E1 component beta subunit